MPPQYFPDNHHWTSSTPGSGPPDWFMGIFLLFFLVIAGVILVAIVQSAGQYIENSNSPVLETLSRVVAKRTAINRNGANRTSSIYTSYFVTFEDETGARCELSVKGNEYGLLVEGDEGTLTSQGTWFKDFVRHTGGRGDDGLLKR